MSDDNKIIKRVNTRELSFDYKNPRLIEFGVNKKTSAEEILQTLWDEMAVEEIVLSIAASGFLAYEPLIVIKENGKNVVIEGNRRLAAVKAILTPGYLEQYAFAKIPNISEKIRKDLEKLPVLDATNREAAWRFIGFKHVNGPAKWGSYAKAQYIAEVHKAYSISLDDIALQIGDTHRTVQRLYRALMIIKQAEKVSQFNLDNIKTSRLYFSHLYTGLDYDGIKRFLGVKDAELESENPVPKEKHKELGELLRWMYGSKKHNQDNLIKSQNPHLKQLDDVLQNKEAIAALRRNEPLELAFVAKEYFGNRAEALVFGTAEQQNFMEKVNALCLSLGEGGGFENKNKIPPDKVKDDKLDVVVWKSFADRNVSKLIGFGQCKTGMAWRSDNSLTQLRPESFCKKWFRRMPTHDPARMFFIADTFYFNTWYSHASDAGIVFDRFRLMDYLPNNKEFRNNVYSDLINWTNEAIQRISIMQTD